MDEQGTQVGVAAFGDAQEPLFPTARVLARRQPQVGRHLPAVLELLAVIDGGHQCGGGERADTGECRDLHNYAHHPRRWL